MTTKRQILIAVVLFVVGAAVGRFSLPAKVVTKTEVKVVEKEVVKWKERDQIDKDKTYKKTVNKDGSQTIEIVDKSKIDKSKSGSDQVDKTTEKTTEKTVEYNKNSLLFSVSGGIQVDAPEKGLVYGAQIQKRLLGPVWIGATANTQKAVGMSIGLGF